MHKIKAIKEKEANLVSGKCPYSEAINSGFLAGFDTILLFSIRDVCELGRRCVCAIDSLSRQSGDYMQESLVLNGFMMPLLLHATLNHTPS
jgi:hypothetical protein